MQNLIMNRLAPISNEMKNQKTRMHFSNGPFSFWDQFNSMKVFPLFQTILNSFFQLPCSDKKMSLPSNLVPRVPSFYIRTKSRLKTPVTTVHLLQCKTNVIIGLCIVTRNNMLLREKSMQIKEDPSSEISIDIKKMFQICLHSSTFV